MKHFVVRRASKKYPEDKVPADDPAALRDRVRKLAADSFPELVDARRRRADVRDRAGRADRAREGEPGRGRGHRPVRALGGGAPLRAGRARAASRAGCRSTFRTSSTTRIWCRCAGPTRSCPSITEGPPEHRRRRDGFGLTDPRMSRREVASEADYCLYCHEREKDSCSTGMHDKSGAVKRNPLGVKIDGCPLDEKIGEMHVLRKDGDSIGGAGDDRRRQPDAARHRPPHLQRLHEGVRLPEAGAGQHPAGGDRRADRRARDALGLRDLRPADALEPAQPHAARSRGRTSARTCWSSGSGRRASRWRTTWSTPASAWSASTASRSSRCRRI